MPSSDIAVSVRGLSKSYTIASNDVPPTTAAEAIVHRFKKPRSRSQGKTFWALKDIDFDIHKGDVVGIIGRNGAGKSTLLKILSRVTEPTTGRIDLYGRVGSLLEVGTGFHPELTGRENIFLNGAILGMSRREIAIHFDDIVAFAEVEQFLDTPVKRYSSGMYVRLAFAVAAHLDPEILIVDEVLAVGDAAFQKKCLGKMQDVAEQEGRTILFVSHNTQAVSTLTKKCIMLSHGHSVFTGPTQEAISLYLSEGKHDEGFYKALPSPTEARVTYVEVRTSEPASVQAYGEPLEMAFEIVTPVSIKDAALSFQIVNEVRQPATHILTLDSELPMCREPGVYRLVCRIPSPRLYMGRYTLDVHLSEGKNGRVFQNLDGICPFEVVVHGQMRDHFWHPGAAAYVEEADWHLDDIARLLPSDHIRASEIYDRA